MPETFYDCNALASLCGTVEKAVAKYKRATDAAEHTRHHITHADGACRIFLNQNGLNCLDARMTNLAASLRGDMKTMEASLRGEMSGLRGEMNGVRADMVSLRNSFHSDVVMLLERDTRLEQRVARLERAS